jgi:HD-GYP domain-containing protein (c-di-GMP phosphodiesterase class II)/ribonuclease BN (tRNA processing enzyme)
MSEIRILGAQGSRADHAFTTCIQLTPHTLIDAGNIMHALGEEAIHIHRIFFSHAHLDHIVDSAFMIDNFFAKRTQTLSICALKETIEALRTHLFNDAIWPDFTKISLIGSDKPALRYEIIEPYRAYPIEDEIVLTPIPANHTVPCCGYIIEQKEGAILFSGDSFHNELVWKTLNEKSFIKALILDVSFPNRLAKIAKASKHLTPAFLEEDLKQLCRSDVTLYVNHLKPFYTDQITAELVAMGIPAEHILKDGELIDIATGKLRHSQLLSSDEKLHKLTQIGTALSANKHLDTLLEMIVCEAKNITNADGGTLYLLDERQLRFQVVQTDSLNIKMGGTNEAISWPPLPLYLEDGTPNNKMVAAMCALEDRLINIPDVYEAEGFSFEGTKKFDAGTGYRSKSMLVIPMKNHENEIIGVLQLINKQLLPTHEVVAFDEEDENITLSLASQAAIAITNTSLIQGLESLLESFLKSIIFAISKKSPYTAGHIKRMVKLSLMFADAIDRDETLFKEKRYSKDEIKVINFAALMHDIGKLATPEYVIDKATKLEALFDRIALIESRFQSIQKSLHVSFLEQKIAVLEGRENTPLETLQKNYDEKTAYLNEALELIRQSNRGDSFLSDDKVAKIQALSKEVWTIGDETYTLLSENEAYNLMTQKGTLTYEERTIINDHAKLSVDILNKLPFPKKYKEIPQISGNHHEKINGKGYPQGLQGEKISFEARMLAITDIFEALTASDRPYKAGMPLSTAMKILYTMAKEGELDKALVKFFYTSGIYLEYAKTYLPERSIDSVTVDFNDLA